MGQLVTRPYNMKDDLSFVVPMVNILFTDTISITYSIQRIQHGQRKFHKNVCFIFHNQETFNQPHFYYFRYEIRMGFLLWLWTWLAVLLWNQDTHPQSRRYSPPAPVPSRPPTGRTRPSPAKQKPVLELKMAAVTADTWLQCYLLQSVLIRRPYWTFLCFWWEIKHVLVLNWYKFLIKAYKG